MDWKLNDFSFSHLSSPIPFSSASEKHFAFFFSSSIFMLRFFAVREQKAQGKSKAKRRQHTQYVCILLIHFFTTPNVDRGKTIQRPIARSFNSDFFLSPLSAFLSSGSYWCCCCCRWSLGFRNNAHTFSCGRYLKHYTVFFYY